MHTYMVLIIICQLEGFALATNIFEGLSEHLGKLSICGEIYPSLPNRLFHRHILAMSSSVKVLVKLCNIPLLIKFTGLEQEHYEYLYATMFSSHHKT